MNPYAGYELPPDWAVRPIDCLTGSFDLKVDDWPQFGQRCYWLVFDATGRWVSTQGHYLGMSTAGHVAALWCQWYQTHWTNEEG